MSPVAPPLPANQRPIATAWLGLGIAALAIAGVFALLLVLARAPGTSALFPGQDFFRVALVVHVDQSILIWLLAFTALLAALRPGVPVGPSWVAFAIAAVGCLLAAAAPFLGAAAPLLVNYVPVLDHPLFLAALALFAAGVLAQLLAYLAATGRGDRDPIALGLATTALALGLTLVSLVWSWLGLTHAWDPKAYYEYLFWGPGHVLQFAYTQLMLVAWIWLARAIARPLPLSDGAHRALLVLGVVPLVVVPFIHFLYLPDSPEARLAFTRLMQFGNGLAAVPLGLLLLIALIGRGRSAIIPVYLPIYRALVASLILFVLGGLIGASISGSNTVVPAHYHGAIVAVNLALMGLTFHLLPRLGFGHPVGAAARWQPLLYGWGQVLHIGGLGVSGLLGIQRKTAGAAQGLEGWGPQLAMGVMGLGGLLAVIAGVLFIVVVIAAFTRRPDPDGVG